MQFAMHRLIGAAAVAGLVLAGVSSHIARADAVQDLAAAAAKKGPVIWYESSPPEQILKVAAAFNKRYPDIKIQFVRNTGGGGIAARVIQESEAGAATAPARSPSRAAMPESSSAARITHGPSGPTDRCSRFPCARAMSIPGSRTAMPPKG